MIKSKIKEWFRRYAFAEFMGFIFTIAFSNLALNFSGSYIFAGIIGTWADNIGFYGIIAYNDLKKDKKNKKSKIKGIPVLIRNSIVEFGPAEYLDSFLIRPFYLSVFPYLIVNYTLAISVATILANITYYIPTIASYELRKKLLKDH